MDVPPAQQCRLPQPEPFFIDVIPHITPLTCYGANDGTATIIASGGTEPYTFQWTGVTGNPNTSTVTGLAPGVYNVYVSDSNGCTATNIQVVIPMPDPPFLSCPPDVSDVISGNGCTMQLSTIEDPVIENFCNYTLSYILTGATTGSGVGLVNDLFFQTGITNVEYTVTDVAGNSMSCVFTVTIHSVTAPGISVGCADVTDTVSGNNCSVVPGSIQSPILTDNCFATASLTLTYSMTGTTTGTGTGSVVGEVI